MNPSKLTRKTKWGHDTKVTNREYSQNREATYPGLGNGTHPHAQAEADYDAYKALTAASNRTDNEYERQFAFEKKAFDEYGKSGEREKEERAFYESRDLKYRAQLFPEQHERLVSPSSVRHDNMIGMANSRDNFLNDYPYGYRNRGERKKHEKFRTSAYNETLKASNDFQTHHRYAGDPSDPTLDKYGRRVPRY